MALIGLFKAFITHFRIRLELNKFYALFRTLARFGFFFFLLILHVFVSDSVLCYQLSTFLFMKLKISLVMIYQEINRVTHEEWDCKDDLKLLNYEDPKVKLSLLPGIQSFNNVFIWFSQKRNRFKVGGNHAYKGTAVIFSYNHLYIVHHLWVTL